MNHSVSNRGFATIATGDMRYYILARNLLRSYKRWTRQETPFCLICEEENEYTQEFDKIIIMEKPTRSYVDKLQLYKYLPYDETIFIDADSLAYGDLNAWWDVFDHGTDFSSFGCDRRLDSGIGWFDPNKIGDYRESVLYMPDLEGGVYYMRRSETCEKVFELAQYFAGHYHEYGFLRYSNAPADEPVLSLAMAMHGCHTHLNIFRKGIGYVCNMPRFWLLHADITKPYVSFKTNGEWFRADLIHWGNKNTRYAPYRFDLERLNFEDKMNPVAYFLLYKTRLRLGILHMADLRYFPQRLKNHIRK